MALAENIAPDTSGEGVDVERMDFGISEPAITLVVAPPDQSALRSLARRLDDADASPPLDVRTVDSAADALTSLSDSEMAVSCIVSPYTLPESDGVELVEAVRASDPDVPFILVAGDGDETVASRAISAGVTDYFPLDRVREEPPLLATRIGNAVEKHRVERKARQGFLALETTEEGVGLLDDDGQFTYVTDDYAEAYGYEPTELLGTHWSDLHTEEACERIHGEVLPMVRETGFWAGEMTAERADGSTFPEQHTVARTGDGRLVCAIRDLSEVEGVIGHRGTGQAPLHELYDVTASSLPFEEKIEQLLELGCEQFGLDIGMLTCEHESAFEIEYMVGDHPELDEGVLTPPMTENYCRRVVETGNLISVANAGDAGWGDDALYHEFGLESYAGVEVTGGDDVYGTICFSGCSPRDRPFTQREQTFLELMARCVSYELERKGREDHLTALNALARDLMDVESVDGVSKRVVDAAGTTLDMPVAAIARYGDDGLEPVARTDDAAALLESVPALDKEGVGWRAFIEGAPERTTDLPIDDESPLHPPVTELAAFPLSNYGVLLVGSTGSDGFSPADFDFAETVASNTEAAIERADREQRLQERERTLQTQNEKLSRLHRINDIIRGIDQALVNASTREEIDRVVCEELASADTYELAWIGTRQPHTDEVVPREAAGSDPDYLDEVTITVDPDEPEGQGPTGRAIRTREPQVNNDVLTDRSFAPWRREALDRGYYASIALPLVYEDSFYGVLNVYASEPGVFGDLERTVLEELSNTIAYAINSVESKKALVSERVTELDFRVTDGVQGLGLTSEVDCELTLEALVTTTDGAPRIFFSTRGAPVEALLESGSYLPVTDLSLVNEYEDGGEPVGVFEATLTDESLPRILLDHGAVLKGLTAADGEATLTIELPATADIRGFREMFQTKYPDSELLAQRTHERDEQTRSSFKARLLEELTPRQLEALQTAYFSGFFETPRERTGTEIADSLGVSQPTFNNHVRVAHRKLCQLLFEDGVLSH